MRSLCKITAEGVYVAADNTVCARALGQAADAENTTSMRETTIATRVDVNR